MKLVSFVSLKGGAGKTTALMAAASGLRSRSARIAMFEADANDPLKYWRSNARGNGTWDEDCAIYEAASLEEFKRSYAEAAGQGVDIALLDLEGGASELNTTAAISSDLILIPLSLTALDIEYGIQTFQFVRNALKENGVAAQTALLICRFPPSKDKLSKAELESLEILEPLPQVTARLPTRAAHADMAVSGMLHLYHERLASDPKLRVVRNSTRIAVKEAQAVADDILDAVKKEAPADAHP